jgi:hypothetical protein
VKKSNFLDVFYFSSVHRFHVLEYANLFLQANWCEIPPTFDAGVIRSISTGTRFGVVCRGSGDEPEVMSECPYVSVQKKQTSPGETRLGLTAFLYCKYISCFRQGGVRKYVPFWWHLVH